MAGVARGLHPRDTDFRLFVFVSTLRCIDSRPAQLDKGGRAPVSKQKASPTCSWTVRGLSKLKRNRPNHPASQSQRLRQVSLGFNALRVEGQPGTWEARKRALGLSLTAFPPNAKSFCTDHMYMHGKLMRVRT